MSIQRLVALVRRAASVSGLSLVAVGTSACGASSADPGGPTSASDDALTSAAVPSPLTASDFSETLDEATIRATVPYLSDADFAVKWTAAFDDAYDFFRAFPAAFHRDLGTIPAARVPGVETVCAGDPHPDNFGWMDEGSTFFALNDFDDSGDCPVAFDALRFLVGTELDFGDAASKGLTKDALASYLASVASGTPDTVVDASLAPSWKKVQKDTLAADVDGSTFILGKGTKLSALDDATRAAIVAWLPTEPRLAGAAVLDMAAYDHDSGGSAELPRAWLLVEESGATDILELKTEVEPGVEWGRHAHVVEGPTRMAVLEGVFWPVVPADDSFLVTFGGSEWLVRSRLRRADSGIDALKSKDQKNELLAAASQLGVAHAQAWKGVSTKKLSTWLADSADVLTARWKAARKADN